MICIDWLSAYQDHAGAALPVMGQDLVIWTDPATGEARRELVTGFMHEGSHDSRLRIRCDGTRVEVSGNPSKWNRLENVFGLPTVDAGLAVYNRVLSELGLPPLTSSVLLPSERKYAAGGTRADGCVITRVDLTCNMASGGMHQGRAALRWLSSQRWQGRVGHLYSDGDTVDWKSIGTKSPKGGSRYTYLKYYLKFEELKRSANSLPAGPEHDDDRQYLFQVAELCRLQGLVRQEVTLKSKYLRRHGLNDPIAWRGLDLAEILEGFAVHKRADVTVTDYHRVAETLRAQGESPQRAQKMQGIVFQWLMGGDPFEGMSRATRYRYLGLGRALGLDLANPCDVSVLRTTVQVVELRPVEIPDWYRQAA